MKRVEPWKTWTFVGSLAVVALLIKVGVESMRPRDARPVTTTYSEPSRSVATPAPSSPQRIQPVIEYVPPQPEPRYERQEIVREKTPQELAEAHAAYLARYLNTRDTRKEGMKTVAVVVASENGKLNASLATVIADRLKSEATHTLTSLFTPAFVSDGLFGKAFDGSPAVSDKLELAQIMDALVLARQTVRYTTNTSLENVITATMQLDVVAAPVSTGGENQAWSFSANGAGFKPSDARAMAEERIAKQIATDTRLSIP